MNILSEVNLPSQAGAWCELGDYLAEQVLSGVESFETAKALIARSIIQDACAGLAGFFEAWEEVLRPKGKCRPAYVPFWAKKWRGQR